MKKNNTAEKTIQDAEKLTKALKESTEKSLKDIMNEAISNLIMEGEDDDEKTFDDNLEDSYDVKDVDTNDIDETPADSDDEDVPVEDGENADADVEDAEDADDDEWSDMEEFKVGDNDYDFTGVDGETALKVYNKLGDDDQIFVKKDEDGNYKVKDEETGAEYVIELNDDAANEDENPEPEFDGADAEDEDGEVEFEFDFGDDDVEDSEGKPETEDSVEISVDGDASEDDEKDDEDNLNEDKNMIVNDYQKKTAMTLPSDKGEVAGTDSKKFAVGAPKNGGNGDASRPYGKRGDDVPFDEKVSECGSMDVPANLEEDGQGLNTKHKMVKSTNRLNKDAQGQHVASDVNDATVKALRESAQKIYNKAKEIRRQNKLYEACIEKLKKSIYEAGTLNVNMGKVIKLLVNETTTANEKRVILERFNGVKTIKEGTMLYDTIKRELNESKKANANVLMEKQISAKTSNTLNETTIYQNPSLDLMNRMDNLYK